MTWIFRSSKTLLIHGLESDWIEEEISDQDGEFLKDVLEQKVLIAFTTAGIQRKVCLQSALLIDIIDNNDKQVVFKTFHIQITLLHLSRWKEGPNHRNFRPVVVQFKHRWVQIFAGLISM